MYGGENRVVTRWAKSPTVTAVNATEEDIQVIGKLVSELNEVLHGSGISIRQGDGDENEIRIIFTLKKSIPRLAEELGGHHVQEGTGYFVAYPNDRFEIERAVAVIGSELTGNDRRATIVHELTHTLGLMGHSPVFPESAVFASKTKTSSASRLAPIDRKLIRFLYLQLNPGDRWEEVRWAFETHWPR